jgi:hypothetical protein
VQTYGPWPHKHGETPVGDFGPHDTWYSAPREMQIIDERPAVRDFREAPTPPKPIALPPGPGEIHEVKSKPASSEDDWVDQFDPKASGADTQNIDSKPVPGAEEVPLPSPNIPERHGYYKSTTHPRQAPTGSINRGVSGDTFTSRELMLIQKYGVVDPRGNGSYLWLEPSPAH